MKYSFDEIIDRKNTACLKHDKANVIFNTEEDILPMWIADMDFKSPSCIIEAMKKRCDHPIFGYTFPSYDYYKAVINWFDKRYDIQAERKQLHFIPGIVAGISFVLQTFTKPGDNILITTPVYPPFINVPRDTGRNLVISKLKTIDGRLYVDYEDFEEKAKQAKVFIMANPHNPGGVVWTKDELIKIADICHRNNVLVISDEIHADLTFSHVNHTSFSRASDIAKNISITFIAPSKTFNIAGLASSIAYIANDQIREKYFNYLDFNHLANGNIFAFEATTAAFTMCDEWLDNLNKYIYQNVEFLVNYIDEHLPKIKYLKPESSFLIWLDFSEYGMDHKTLKNILINDAKVGLNDGLDFGDECSCCMRMNIGCPKVIVEKALQNIKTALLKNGYE